MIKFWLSVLMFILCIIGIILLSVLLFDDYVAKSNLDKYHKKEVNNVIANTKAINQIIDYIKGKGE